MFPETWPPKTNVSRCRGFLMSTVAASTLSRLHYLKRLQIECCWRVVMKDAFHLINMFQMRTIEGTAEQREADKQANLTCCSRRNHPHHAMLSSSRIMVSRASLIQSPSNCVLSVASMQGMDESLLVFLAWFVGRSDAGSLRMEGLWPCC